MKIVYVNNINHNIHYFTPLSLVASAPTDLTVVQEGSTGIRISRNPPTPLEDTTGYRICYSGGSGGSSGSVDVSGGSTDNHLLSCLQNGVSYGISVMGISDHFFSDSVVYSKNISLGMYRVV